MNRTRVWTAFAAATGLSIALIAGSTPATWASGASAAPHALASISPQQQSAYESQVAQFTSTHPQPTHALNISSTDFAAFNKLLYSYWNSVPWPAVFGQWGCTVSSVGTSLQGGVATLTSDTNCGSGGSQVAFLAASQVATKTEVVASNPAAASAMGTSATGVVHPDSWTSNCIVKSSAYICVLYNSSTLSIGASTQWESSTATTGYARLGVVGISNPCANGTLYAQSGSVTLHYLDEVQVLASMNQDTTWSSSFFNPSFYGQHCAVY